MKRCASHFMLLLFLVCFPFSLQATLIYFNPSTIHATPGNSFSLDLNISGLDDGSPAALGAYDVDILFDPSIITFQSLVFGSGLDLYGSGANASYAGLISPGMLDIFEVSFDDEDELNAFQPGSFTLATLTFGAINPGTSLLNIIINDYGLADAFGEPLFSDIESGSVTVNSSAPVPEPATLLLISTGLAGIGILRKKRK